MVPYEMTEIIRDLLDFSAQYLTLGGRLVYWFPHINEIPFQESLAPRHPCLNYVTSSRQGFSKWSRRLITMEKCHPYVESLHGKDILTLDVGFSTFLKEANNDSLSSNGYGETSNKEFRNVVYRKNTTNQKPWTPPPSFPVIHTAL